MSGGERPGPANRAPRAAVVDGRELRSNLLTRMRDRGRALLTTATEEQELELEGRLRASPALSRTNTVAIVSPKGGVGKTATTFLVGSLLATHTRLRVLAVDLNAGFGTLAALAPAGSRVDASLLDLVAARSSIETPAELGSYVSRLPSGLHLLASPARTEAVAELTPEVYAQLLRLLERFYEAILLDAGTGIAGPVARFAIERSDRTLVVATPEWMSATAVLGALEHLPAKRTTLVLNQAGKPGGEGHALQEHFDRQRLPRQVTVPHDEQLSSMLATGTYTLQALDRRTRVAIKRLGLAVSEQLV